MNTGPKINFNKELWFAAREKIKSHPENFLWEKDWCDEGGCGSVGCIAGHICELGRRLTHGMNEAVMALGFYDHELMRNDFCRTIYFGYELKSSTNISAVQAMDDFYKRWEKEIMLASEP